MNIKFTERAAFTRPHNTVQKVEWSLKRQRVYELEEQIKAVKFQLDHERRESRRPALRERLRTLEDEQGWLMTKMAELRYYQ